jgi:hypothetical protein
MPPLIRYAALLLLATSACWKERAPEARHSAINGEDAGQSCVPIGCKDAQAECGQISDGCGATVSCGGCKEPSLCGGAGIANQCAPRQCTWAKLVGCDTDENLLSDALAECTKVSMQLNSHAVGRACGDHLFEGAVYQCCTPKAG